MTHMVLIVDDDATICELLQLTLESEGYHTLTSVGGASLTVAHERQPDLILMDIWMPGMDGIEASKRLRADPATAHIPIIAMSAHVSILEGYWDLLVNDRLPKPFDLDTLLAMVARWVPSHDKNGE